ncbi:hypothetical protein NZA98_35285, partial [Escherichia coli]|nr:hypothetical protein [Escherichia coli]
YFRYFTTNFRSIRHLFLALQQDTLFQCHAAPVLRLPGLLPRVSVAANLMSAAVKESLDNRLLPVICP